MITEVQGGTERQFQFFDGTVRALKWLFPSLTMESKESVSVNNLKAGEGDWCFLKEALGCKIDTEAVTIALLKRKLQEMNHLLSIPATQQRIGRKELERLVGNL